MSFLAPLAARGAVIEIPQYRNRRKIVRKVGERKVGSNQFGPVTSLVSNKDVFSFSVRIHDKTIVVKDEETGKEEIGAFRNYMIVDCDGHWYDGWNKIVWDPTLADNAFLADNKLFTGNSVVFEHYVHPNRWQSVYGAPHLLKKMLVTRLSDEAKFYRNEVKRLKGLGFILLSGSKTKSRAVVATGATEAIKVDTLEMILGQPEFKGEYKKVADSVSGLKEAYNRQKLLTYSWKTALQFVIRANEVAFMLYGFKEDGSAKIASWMKGRKWGAFKKTPRSAEYQKMVLGSEMALMYRKKQKTEHVSV